MTDPTLSVAIFSLISEIYNYKILFSVRSRPQVKRFTPPRKLNSDEESESGSDYSDSEYSSDYSDSEDYSSE